MFGGDEYKGAGRAAKRDRGHCDPGSCGPGPPAGPRTQDPMSQVMRAHGFVT